jgi:hypothetical protein
VRKQRSAARPSADAYWQPLAVKQARATPGPLPQQLGSRSPEKIPVITEKLLAAPFGQAFVSPEIIVPKVPQQISASSLVVSPAPPTNARHIEIWPPPHRSVPMVPWHIGLDGPERAESSSGLLRILDHPPLGTTFGNLDGGNHLHEPFGFTRKPALKYRVLNRPEKPVGVENDNFREGSTAILAKI